MNSAGWASGELRAWPAQECAEKPAERQHADRGQHPGSRLPPGPILFDCRPEPVWILLHPRLTALAHAQWFAVGRGRETPDSVQVDRVIESVRLNEKAEFLGGLQHPGAKLASACGHGFLILQGGPEGQALEFGMSFGQVSKRSVNPTVTGARCQT